MQGPLNTYRTPYLDGAARINERGVASTTVSDPSGAAAQLCMTGLRASGPPGAVQVSIKRAQTIANRSQTLAGVLEQMVHKAF